MTDHKDYPEFIHYPDSSAVDALVDDVWKAAQAKACTAEILPENGFGPQLGIHHMRDMRYVRFTPEGMSPFYGYWQPALSQPAPLLVHVPGYGAEISIHPDLVAQGYNVLHINPLGYMTPEGPDTSKGRDGHWPVFGETVFSGGDIGYRQWFINCIQAITWAQQQDAVLPNRVSFFGTSQGGGTSLLLGSIYQGRGVRCVAADEPWMVNFPMCKVLQADWFAELLEGMSVLDDPGDAWRVLGSIDALSHAYRLTVPVLLTAGGQDQTCPAPTIQSLFELLPHTKAYYYLHDKPHQHTQEFIALAAGWFRLYA